MKKNIHLQRDAGARDAVIRSVQGRLIGIGWKLEDVAQDARKSFDHLLPKPDRTFSLTAPEGQQRYPVALHFAQCEDALRYACTMRRSDSDFPQEHGCLDLATGSITVVSTRGNWNVSVPEVAAGAGLAPETAYGDSICFAAQAETVDSTGPMLDEILASISANGTHVHRWAMLRRAAFPKSDGWRRLQDWCSDHCIECELSFGQSSKDAEVQFRKRV